MRFSDEEIARVNRARLAWELHVLPSAIDAMPYQDYLDLINVRKADTGAKQK